MVNLLRTVHLGVSVLVLATVAYASPIPNPHKPQLGEIVHYDPHRGGGIGHAVSSALQGHKASHITVGHDQYGHAILAPIVSHEQSMMHPSVSTKGMGHLHGAVLLDQTVIAHPDNIHHASGKNKGHVVGKEHLDNIQGGRALVNAHLLAAAAHDKAHQAHAQAEAAHREAADKHHKAGKHELGQAFEALADQHHATAERQQQLANIHRGSAPLVMGADPEVLRETQKGLPLTRLTEAQGHESADIARGAIAHLHAQR